MINEETKSKLALVTDTSFEKSVIGAILLDFSCYQKAVDLGITYRHFFDDFCKRIFAVCKDISESMPYAEINQGHIHSEFLKKFGEKQKAKLDGQIRKPIEAIYILKAGVSSTGTLKADCYKLIENHLKRMTILLVDDIGNRVNDNFSILDTIQLAVKQMNDISEMIPTSGTESALSVYSEITKKDTSIFKGESLSEDLYLDFSAMKNHIIRKGELIVIGARPSMGKTATMLNFAQKLYERNEKGSAFYCDKVGIISLEMSNNSIVRRLKMQLASFPKHKLKSEQDLITERNILIKRNVDLSKYVIVKDPKSELSDILAYVSDLAKQGCKAVFIDYLGLISCSYFKNNKPLEVGEITKNLARLAKKLNIPIFLLSQLSRECEKRSGFDKRPNTNDLRDSGTIEQDADQILMLFRPAYAPYKLAGYEDPNGNDRAEFGDNSRLLEINCLKDRSGSCAGEFYTLEYNLECQEIKDYDSSVVCGYCRHEKVVTENTSNDICECCERPINAYSNTTNQNNNSQKVSKETIDFDKFF